MTFSEIQAYSNLQAVGEQPFSLTNLVNLTPNIDRRAVAPDEPLYGIDPPIGANYVVTQLVGNSKGESDCMKFTINSPGTQFEFDIFTQVIPTPIEYILL